MNVKPHISPPETEGGAPIGAKEGGSTGLLAGNKRLKGAPPTLMEVKTETSPLCFKQESGKEGTKRRSAKTQKDRGRKKAPDGRDRADSRMGVCRISSGPQGK